MRNNRHKLKEEIQTGFKEESSIPFYFCQEVEEPAQRDCSVSILGYFQEQTGTCQALKESSVT